MRCASILSPRPTSSPLDLFQKSPHGWASTLGSHTHAWFFLAPKQKRFLEKCKWFRLSVGCLSVCLRETSRPLQPSLKLPVATSCPRSFPSQLTNFTKTWHSQLKRSFALGLLFHSVLSQTHSRRLRSDKLQAFPTAVRQAGGFLYGLTTHKQNAALTN